MHLMSMQVPRDGLFFFANLNQITDLVSIETSYKIPKLPILHSPIFDPGLEIQEEKKKMIFLDVI